MEYRPEDERALITLIIKSISGLQFILENINPRDDVSVLRERIQIATNWPLEEYTRVIFKGRIISSGTTIESCEIGDGATIHYIHPSRGD